MMCCIKYFNSVAKAFVTKCYKKGYYLDSQMKVCSDESVKISTPNKMKTQPEAEEKSVKE